MGTDHGKFLIVVEIIFPPLPGGVSPGGLEYLFPVTFRLFHPDAGNKKQGAGLGRAFPGQIAWILYNSPNRRQGKWDFCMSWTHQGRRHRNSATK
jgi:hypothetical protein